MKLLRTILFLLCAVSLYGAGGGTVYQVSSSCTFNSTCGTSTDSGGVFNFNGSSLTATLPSSPPTMPWIVALINAGTTSVTVARNGNTINGAAANLTVSPGQSTTCASDTVTGSNYVCTPGTASISGTVNDAVIIGSGGVLADATFVKTSGNGITDTLQVTGGSSFNYLQLGGANRSYVADNEGNQMEDLGGYQGFRFWTSGLPGDTQILQLGRSTSDNTADFYGAITDKGPTFTASGCSNGTLVGGSMTGSYKSGTNGTCTVTVTVGNGAGAANGWACSVWDITTTADAQKQTGYSTTTVTFSGTTVSGDVIVFECKGF